MLKNEFDSENFAYLSLAKQKIPNPKIYYCIINNYESNSTLARKNKIKIPIKEKKIGKLAQDIENFEESLIHPSNLLITDLIEYHRIPNRFKHLFHDYFFYGEFYKEFLDFNLFNFENQNISIDQDWITKQWYVKLKIFGDTKKKEVLDNWPLITKMQRRMPDYKNPKSEIRSKEYDKLAKTESVESLADTGELSKQKGFKERLKKLKIQEKRRKERFSL